MARRDEPPLQVTCLTSEEGWVYMDSYDGMGPQERRRFRNSPFNLCAACVGIAAAQRGITVLQAITLFEDVIRKGGRPTYK